MRFSRFSGLAAVAAAAVASRAAALSEAQLSGAIADGAAQLLAWYNYSSGMFGDGYSYWTSANQIETLANWAIQAGPEALALAEPVFANSLVQLATLNGNDAWRDDHLWVILAYARVYEATGNATYLAAASEAIFADIVGPWQAWNTSAPPCGGGVNWEKGVPYRNSITNELFLTAAARLAELTGSTAPVSNFSYAGWAGTEWAWLNASGLYQPAQGIFIDGLSEADCTSTTGAFWTYNAGVLLDGLALMAAGLPGGAGADPALAEFAWQVAQAATRYFSAVNDSAAVMRELSCGNPDGFCGGVSNDARQFKGAFVRHFGYMVARLAPAYPELAGWAEGWLAAQAASILANDANATAPGMAQYGQLWQGPFQTDASPWSSHGSAMDALLALQAVLRARRAA